jgi:hypothetical protein
VPHRIRPVLRLSDQHDLPTLHQYLLQALADNGMIVDNKDVHFSQDAAA